MPEMKRATETFAWEGGMVQWRSELPADAPAVQAFPGFFEDVVAEGAEQPAAAPKKTAKPKKAAPDA